MRIQFLFPVLTILCTCTLSHSQVPVDGGAPALTPPGLPPSRTPAQTAPVKPVQDMPPAAVPPSGILQPSLDTVQQTLGSLRLERWKRGSIRDEASDNVDQILGDIKNNLPALMQDADGTPASVSKMLAVSRNVGALYDVMLRVVEGARVVAPGDQVDALQQALLGLSSARLALDKRIQDAAAATEKQVVELRATVQKQAGFKCPAPPVPVAKPCVPTPHRARRKTPAKTPEKKSEPAKQKPAAQGTTPPKTGP
ncbi:MAG TPA: hypothetical protein VMU48_06340 [Terracidiphilus sp.]|nr:hypothetical protein [Terracidiphilus sp.]